MIPSENLVTFLVASLVIIIVPGPSVLFVIGRSISLGRRAGVLSVVGNTLGTVPAVIAVAVGIGAIVATSLVAFTVIKFVGAGYLIWLGVQAIRNRSSHIELGGSMGATTSTLLRQGFIVGLTNPKTIAFFTAVLPQFADPAAGGMWLQLITLGLIFQALALASDTVWALAAGSARHWFARSSRRRAGFATAGGVTMIGLGGAVALAGARD